MTRAQEQGIKVQKIFIVMAMILCSVMGQNAGAAFSDLSAEQQQQARANFQRYQQMSPEQQQKLQTGWGKFSKLSDQDKKVLETRYQKFKSLPPERQQQLTKLARSHSRSNRSRRSRSSHKSKI